MLCIKHSLRLPASLVLVYFHAAFHSSLLLFPLFLPLLMQLRLFASVQSGRSALFLLRPGWRNSLRPGTLSPWAVAPKHSLHPGTLAKESIPKLMSLHLAFCLLDALPWTLTSLAPVIQAHSLEWSFPMPSLKLQAAPLPSPFLACDPSLMCACIHPYLILPYSFMCFIISNSALLNMAL